jgi:CheY-like chemotaxis protein
VSRVLLADDHLLIAESVSLALCMNDGFTVDLSDSLSTTLHKLNIELSYDIVMLDLRMPGMDGYAVVRALRARHGPGLPIVMLTADIQPDALARALAAGANGHLSKPIDPAALHSALERHARVPTPLPSPVPSEASTLDRGPTAATAPPAACPHKAGYRGKVHLFQVSAHASTPLSFHAEGPTKAPDKVGSHTKDARCRVILAHAKRFGQPVVLLSAHFRDRTAVLPQRRCGARLFLSGTVRPAAVCSAGS